MDDNLFLAEQRPNRADAVKNRELLLQAAAQLFMERGVDHVTMSEIAAAAHVGKGTLYRHFNNKTELCLALLDQDQRDLQNQALRRFRTSTNPPLDDLRWFLEQVVGFVARNLPLLYMVGDTTAPLMLNHQAHFWWRQTIRGLLSRADLSGDLDYMADALYILVGAHTVHYQLTVQHYDLPRIIAGLHHTLDRLNNR